MPSNRTVAFIFPSSRKNKAVNIGDVIFPTNEWACDVRNWNSNEILHRLLEITVNRTLEFLSDMERVKLFASVQLSEMFPNCCAWVVLSDCAPDEVTRFISRSAIHPEKFTTSGKQVSLLSSISCWFELGRPARNNVSDVFFIPSLTLIIVDEPSTWQWIKLLERRKQSLYHLPSESDCWPSTAATCQVVGDLQLSMRKHLIMKENLLFSTFKQKRYLNWKTNKLNSDNCISDWDLVC